MATPSFMKKMLDDNEVRRTVIKKALDGQRYGYMGDPTLHWCIGGYRRDHVNLYYGPSKSGKSTLAMKHCGQEQKAKGGAVIILDSENSLSDPMEVDDVGEYTTSAAKTRRRLMTAGIDPDNCLIRQSNDLSYAFKYAKEWEAALEADPKCISAIMVDSWEGFQNSAALKNIIEGDADKAGNKFGGNAKTINPALKFLVSLSQKYGVAVFSIQHVRVNFDEYGPDFILPGGQTFVHLHDSILFMQGVDTKKGTLLADGTKDTSKIDTATKVGKLVRFKCDKSRATVEGKTGETYMNFQDIKFIEPEQSLFTLATRLGVIVHPLNEKTGNTNNLWWQYPAEAVSPIKANGQAGFVKVLKDDAELYKQIYQDCLDSANLTATAEGMATVGVAGASGDIVGIDEVKNDQ